MRFTGIMILFAVFLTGCSEDTPIPRPKGYFRIDIPEQNYQTYSAECPFNFEIPDYSVVVKNASFSAENCVLDMHFPDFKATVHLTYRELDENSEDNLNELVRKSHDFAMNHQVKANRINETRVIFPDKDVHGVVFDIQGNVASNYQFYVTDSTDHFLRGALYFNVVPNLDSLAPVVEHVKADIDHLIKTVSWKDPAAEKWPVED